MRRIPIIQGQHKVVAEPGVVISTLLGSCVAACLHDADARVGGMNHFLLGEPGEGREVDAADMARYGIHAMELLINDMMKMGARRERLRAHLYGGATIVAGLGGIGARNGEFARRFMQNEGIAVGHCDLGGTRARKVEFLPWDGKVRATQAAEAPPIERPQPVRIEGNDVELF